MENTHTLTIVLRRSPRGRCGGASGCTLAPGARCYETKDGERESKPYALLGLLSRQTGFCRRRALRPVSVDHRSIPGGVRSPGTSGPWRADSALQPRRSGLVSAVLRGALHYRPGPALPPPHLPAPAAHARRNRLLGPHVAIRTPAHRIHLPTRPR